MMWFWVAGIWKSYSSYVTISDKRIIFKSSVFEFKKKERNRHDKKCSPWEYLTSPFPNSQDCHTTSRARLSIAVLGNEREGDIPVAETQTPQSLLFTLPWFSPRVHQKDGFIPCPQRSSVWLMPCTWLIEIIRGTLEKCPAKQIWFIMHLNLSELDQRTLGLNP